MWNRKIKHQQDAGETVTPWNRAFHCGPCSPVTSWLHECVIEKVQVSTYRQIEISRPMHETPAIAGHGEGQMSAYGEAISMF